MKNEITEQKIIELMERDYPREPRKIELGAGYYWRCPWLVCDKELNRWMDFCPDAVRGSGGRTKNERNRKENNR